MLAFHKELTENRWHGLPWEEQMGNIASEVHRIWSCRQRGDGKASDMALKRALELIDLTLAGQSQAGRMGELARLREVICDAWLGTGKYKVGPDGINGYLLPFAVKARLAR